MMNVEDEGVSNVDLGDDKEELVSTLELGSNEKEGVSSLQLGEVKEEGVSTVDLGDQQCQSQTVCKHNESDATKGCLALSARHLSLDGTPGDS
jgi:predicted RNA-binding protein